MFKNYLKVALRNLWKNKSFSTLNILGLGLGMACSLLIILWVSDEQSVDSFHTNGSRLFSVYERQYFDGKIVAFHSTPGVLPDELKRVIPEIEYASGFDPKELNTFQIDNKIIKENGAYAGADFFKMFSYRLLQGTDQSALNSPLSIAVSRKMADDFFGSSGNAIGKTIHIQNKKDFTITAIFENLPENTSDKFDYVLNWKTYLDENPSMKEWGNYDPRTFIMLRAGTNPELLEKKISHFLYNYTGHSSSFRVELGIERFGDMYLHSNFVNGKIEGGRIEYVRLFSIIAIFILLIACINFMNLTTARSAKRSKEIGVRKVVGAIRIVLMRQFIGEAILITLIAMNVAILLVVLILPFFNQLTDKHIALPFNQFSFWTSLVALTILTGFISGSYPVLFLSSFNPIRILKGRVKFSAGATWFRKGLVIFQFVLSIVLIIATIVVSRQINYIQSKNLGYDRENLVYIPIEGDLIGKYNYLKEEASKLPGIISISRTSETPTHMSVNTFDFEWDGKTPNSSTNFRVASVGFDFVNTMKLKLSQGRDFSKDFASDSSSYILNETAAEKVGFKDPIGKPFSLWGKKGKIIGVLEDFHFASLHETIQPLVLRMGEKDDFDNVLVRVGAGKTKVALAGLESLCKQLNPKFTFTYTFSDQEFQKLYQSDLIVGELSNYFAILAVFICCLGLLGLAMFSAEQRTKEIGIRKVLGASVGSLFGLLSQEFLTLIFVALLIATPLAWIAMNKWLDDFAYRINIQWWIFFIAGLLASAIALVTVSFQAIKAAIANPVKSLRSE